MEIEQLEQDINGVVYTHTQANFLKARNVFQKTLTLLQGAVNLEISDMKKSTIDPMAIMSNVDKPEFQFIQDFLLSNVTVTDENGKTVSLAKAEAQNSHFGKHRGDYYAVLFEGVKFHFLPFLGNINELLENIKNFTDKQKAKKVT